MLRLRQVERPLANFFASGIFRLRQKLGPILWQLPPNFRFESDRLASFFALLPRQLQVALVVAETAGRWPMLQDVTTDFLYLRLHGDKKLYSSGYGPRALQRWADRISAWSAGAEPDDAIKADPGTKAARRPRPVYCFFDNTDVKLRAPVDAKVLMKKLGLQWREQATVQ